MNPKLTLTIKDQVGKMVKRYRNVTLRQTHSTIIIENGAKIENGVSTKATMGQRLYMSIGDQSGKIYQSGIPVGLDVDELKIHMKKK